MFCCSRCFLHYLALPHIDLHSLNWWLHLFIYLFLLGGFSFVNVGNCQLKLLLLPLLPLSPWLSHYSANDCYSDVALSNFHDRGCGSRNPPLASLTHLSLLPISKLIINIYDVIWIMWIGMTQYHFEKWRVEIGGRWGIGSSRGERIFHNWNVSQGSCFETLEVQRYECSSHSVPLGEKRTKTCGVIFTTACYLCDRDTLTHHIFTVIRLMSPAGA